MNELLVEELFGAVFCSFHLKKVITHHSFEYSEHVLMPYYSFSSMGISWLWNLNLLIENYILYKWSWILQRSSDSFSSSPVSPDGLLLQSSTVADSTSFEFSDGITETVPCSYIEFAERLLLPQYKDLPPEKVSPIFSRFSCIFLS